MQKHHYRVFGLTVESEFALSRPVRIDPQAEPDVRIALGSVPSSLENAKVDFQGVQANAREMLLHVDGVADYWVRDGAKVTVSPRGSLEAPLVQVYLLGSCAGALLQQRGILPLHGSCVCKHGRGLLIIGASGAGKSTLATTFLAQGWKLVSDDVTPVRFRDGDWYAIPGYPGQKIWEDALCHHQDAMDRMRGVAWAHEGRVKYALDASELFADREVALRQVAAIGVGAGDALELGEVSGFDKVDLLMKNTYRAGLIAEFEGRQRQFQQCIDIAKRVQMVYALRPRGMRTETAIAEHILERMKEGE